MRDIIDPIDPEHLRKPYDKVLGVLRKEKLLVEYRCFEDCYVVALDGSKEYSSPVRHCEKCIVKNHRNGSKSYQHHILGATLINPGKNTVVPLFPEPISNRDGDSKQDCELKAAARWVVKFRRHHSKMPLLLVLDALYANAPFIELLKKHKIHFIMVAKPTMLKALFSEYEARKGEGLTGKHRIEEGEGKEAVAHEFGFANGLGLNASNPEVKVNLLEHSLESGCGENGEGPEEEVEEVEEEEEEPTDSWITDIEMEEKKCAKVMVTGKGRWKIENNKFRTIKTKEGYNFEHSYGHGKENLCTNLGVLCILAFLIDQAQELGCKLFKEALEKEGAKVRLWESFRSKFREIILDGWMMVYGLITGACKELKAAEYGWDTS